MQSRKESEERYYCPVTDCGRSFTFKDELEKHLERRHPGLEPDPPPSHPIPAPVPLEIQPDEAFEAHPSKSLSLALLQQSSGMDKVEDIEELVLRNEELTEFNSGEGVDVEDLVSLQCLSLSHNYISDLGGVGFCISLQELNINNNRVQSLGPLEGLSELSKLFAANNLIREVVSLRSLRKLTVLSLYKNKLYDLDTSLRVLRDLPKLVDLGVERNPCMLQVPNSRYKVIRFLKVKLLDGEEVTQLDREIAVDLFSIEEKEERSGEGFVARLRNTMETEQKRELEDVYRELDQLYAENTALKRENEDLKRKTHGEAKDTAEVEELKLEIVHLKREAANVYILLDENKELREQLASPMDANAYLSDLSMENERLKNRINALEERLIDLKRTSHRPQTSAGTGRPRTSAGRSTSMLEIAEEDDELDAIMAKSSQSLQQMRGWLREMQGER